MQRLLVLASAILAAAAFGPSANPAAAQSGGHPAYVIAEIHVTDPAGFMEYMRLEPATLALFHGRVAGARPCRTCARARQPDGAMTSSMPSATCRTPTIGTIRRTTQS